MLFVIQGVYMNNKRNFRTTNKLIAIAAVLVVMAVLLVNVANAGNANQGSTTRNQVTTRFQQQSAVATRGVDTILDGSFEAGASGDSPDWTETSTVFGTPLCTEAACGLGGGTAGPLTGDVWSWFGGANGGGEIGTMTQSLTISDLAGGTATLEFFVWTGSFDAAGTDSLIVTLDGDPLLTILETDAAYQAGYTLVQLDVSTYDDGTARDLVFTGTDAAGANTNINLDDVSLVIVPGGGETNTPTEEPTSDVTEEPTEEPTATPTDEPPGVELIQNGDFEALDSEGKPDVTPWVIKNATGDKGKCNKDKDGDGIPDKIFANTGDCAFQFKGVPSDAGKIQQTLDLTGVTMGVGDTLNLTFAAQTKGEGLGKGKLVFKYADDTKTKISIDITSTSDVYAPFAGSETLTSADVAKAKINFKMTTESGKVYLDTVSLRLVAAETGTPTEEPTSDGTATETPVETETPAETETPTETPAPRLNGSRG
jgi:hypothetical protein